MVEDPAALVLDLLDEAGPQPLDELLRRSGRSLKTLMRVLERLDRFGLVTRGESEPRLYEITPEGRKARQSSHRPVA